MCQGLHDGVVVDTVAWFESRLGLVGLSVCFHVFSRIPVYAGILFRYSGFLLLPKNGIIGDTELTLGVSVSVDGCLSLCGLVMDWRPVQGVPCLSFNDSWDRLQPP